MTCCNPLLLSTAAIHCYKLLEWYLAVCRGWSLEHIKHWFWRQDGGGCIDGALV